jgi:DNA-binding LacI/PurR family transcriptional regulator
MSTMLKEKKIITIKEIAELAGVAKSTVSEVINNNQKSRVSAKTFAKVKHIIDKYNYVPQVSARALSNRRTYQIGYLVSSKVTLGLANAYFATIQAGVNEACQKFGYQMVVSTYDLSTIKNFVMPQKLMQRSVDALVIAGFADEEVLIQLKVLNIPYIIIGGEYDKDVLCLRSNMKATLGKILDYLSGLGHRSVCFGSSVEIALEQFKKVIRSYSEDIIKAVLVTRKGVDDFDIGINHAIWWLRSKQAERYTAFISNDQICAGFLSELIRNGIQCPKEISVIASSNTSLCEWNSLPISAAASLLEKHGFMACKLLIELLDNRKNTSEVKAALLEEYQPHELIIRSTTGEAPKLKE